MSLLVALPLEPYQLIQAFVHGYLDEAGNSVRLWRIQLKTAIALQDDTAHLSSAIDDMFHVRQTIKRMNEVVPGLHQYGPIHANIQKLLNEDLHDAVQNLDLPPPWGI